MAKTVRTRERPENVKVRNAVLMVIYSSRLTFIHVRQPGRDVEALYNQESFFLCVCRFSTKYWMSQTCIVCGKGMLFGLKCKNCKWVASQFAQICFFFVILMLMCYANP